MKNKVVLITGALTGIGRAAALAFARKGAQIVVSGRRDEAGEALANELRSLGSEAEYIRADVRKELPTPSARNVRCRLSQRSNTQTPTQYDDETAEKPAGRRARMTSNLSPLAKVRE